MMSSTSSTFVKELISTYGVVQNTRRPEDVDERSVTDIQGSWRKEKKNRVVVLVNPFFGGGWEKVSMMMPPASSAFVNVIRTDVER